MGRPGFDPSLEDLLAAASERLGLRLGLDFPPARWPELLRALGTAAPVLGYADAGEVMARLLAEPGTPPWMDTLVRHLTVGETYFFRDPAIFAALRDEILPQIRRTRAGGDRRWLRIWSAGCSTGEEAYSLAITVRECLPDWRDWQVTILASDLNTHSLAVARHGVYRDWSFRAMPPAMRNRHFTAETNGTWRIDPAIAGMVSFVPLNLAEPVYPSVGTNTTAMDVVFCRNVLMYLQPPLARTVVGRLAGCLAEGGWLVVSPVETSMVSEPAMVAQRLPGAILFRRQAGVRGGPPTAAALPRNSPLAPAARPAPPRPVPMTAGTPAADDGTWRVFGEGAAPLERHLARKPDDDHAVLSHARTLANLGRLDEALDWCDRALARARLDPARSYLRGSILVELGRLDEAVAALQRTLYLDPDCHIAQFALGNVFARRGQSGRASRHYRAALEALRAQPPGQVLPDADGLSAGRLGEMIEAILEVEAAA